MNAILRPHAAAVLLLLAPAAALVAAPAQAQQRAPQPQVFVVGPGPTATQAAPAAAPAIERFVMRAMGRLEPGRELRFRLVGTPGGDASLDIPGVTRNLDLRETRPGVYEGEYTIRRRDDLGAFERAVGTLRFGNHRLTARVDVRGDRGDDTARDNTGPQVNDLLPANGERVSERGRTRISARVADEGSGIDPQSIRLLVDGRDVTGRARVEGGEIQYRDDLQAGRHTAEVVAKDRAGNVTRRAWSFDVVDRDRHAGGMPLEVTSHADNARVDAHGRVTLQGRTAPNATVRVQVDSVANVAGVVGVSQPVADVSVQADRDGHFRVRVEPRALPIPGTRFEVRLTATQGTHNAQERLTLHPRA